MGSKKMKSEPIAKRVAVVFAVLFFGLVIIVYFALMHGPGDITKEQRAVLIEIRDVCSDEIAKAYELMQPHVPQGVWEGTMMMGDYYPGTEAGRESWDAEAFALMKNAQAKAQAILSTVRNGIEISFILRQDYYSGIWRMQLSTTLSTSHASVSLVYYPYDEPKLPSVFKPLDDQPFWYYYVLDYV